MPVTKLMERSTAEIVILLISSVVVVILILATVGVLLVELIHPDRDTDAVLSMLFDIVKVLVGAIIGYAAGRAQGDIQASRSHPST